jgi:SAM-dependent methyltransferase
VYKRFRDHLSGSFLFRVNEIKDVSNIVNLLTAMSSNISKHIVAHLTLRSKQLLGTADLSQQQRVDCILPELNHFIRANEKFTDELMAGISISAKTKELMSKSLRGDGVKRLNRRLLEDAYPNCFIEEDIARSNRFGGRILDAGCGVGRDTRYFIERGFMVVSFDASNGMVQKCNEYPHAFCQRLSFLEIDYKEEFDGVWACASLLHLNKAESKRAISKLTNALKPDGVMYISLKSGSGNERDKRGRFFEYYDEESVREVIKSEPQLVIHEMWPSRTAAMTEDDGATWLNLILRKRERV